MAYPNDPRVAPLAAARTAAGRFKRASTGGAPAGRDDALRRVRAAQRSMKLREERFAHLRTAHD